MILTLGLFQLESLTLARAPHRLLDMRLSPQMVASPRVQACLRDAQLVHPSDIEKFLERERISVHEPLVLLCEDGRLSMGAAQKLMGKGFSQIYVVEGGSDGLLRETDDLPSSGNMR